MEFKEYKGKNVDEAITNACIDLGIEAAKLEYEVIEKGSNGFLGIGSKPAIIKAKKNQSVEDIAREFLNKVFTAMELTVKIDIKIVENDKDTNISNKNYVKEKLTQNSIQNSTQLEAFGKNKFTVIYGRKQANIPNTIRNQNYGVIDSLARNGVICSPETRNKLSIEILIEKLSKLNAFHIVIIHPSYLLKYNSSTYPCENIEPSYKLNEGEILAVFYRYICIHFFGYCEIHDENDNEWKYNI